MGEYSLTRVHEYAMWDVNIILQLASITAETLYSFPIIYMLFLSHSLLLSS